MFPLKNLARKGLNLHMEMAQVIVTLPHADQGPKHLTLVVVNYGRRLNSFPLEKMAPLSQTIFSDASSWIKVMCFD